MCDVGGRGSLCRTSSPGSREEYHATPLPQTGSGWDGSGASGGSTVSIAECQCADSIQTPDLRLAPSLTLLEVHSLPHNPTFPSPGGPVRTLPRRITRTRHCL